MENETESVSLKKEHHENELNSMQPSKQHIGVDSPMYHSTGQNPGYSTNGLEYPSYSYPSYVPSPYCVQPSMSNRFVFSNAPCGQNGAFNSHGNQMEAGYRSLPDFQNAVYWGASSTPVGQNRTTPIVIQNKMTPVPIQGTQLVSAQTYHVSATTAFNPYVSQRIPYYTGNVLQYGVYPKQTSTPYLYPTSTFYNVAPPRNLSSTPTSGYSDVSRIRTVERDMKEDSYGKRVCLQQTPPVKKDDSALEKEIVNMLCMLGNCSHRAPHYPPSAPSAPSAPPAPSMPSYSLSYKPTLSISPSPSLSSSLVCSRGYGHALCSFCHKRNALRMQDPPTHIRCYSCNQYFPIVRRYLHGYNGPIDDDPSLELPCLRGVKDPAQRQQQIEGYLQSVATGRRCSYSSKMREVQKLMSTMITKIDKMVTKQQKHVEEECSSIMSSLLTRVELYCEGNLHCRCFQPAYLQRHFIQCDTCDIWYHTSCVGVDSRKLATIMEFSCPWCMKDTESEEDSKSEDAKEGNVEDDKACECPLCGRLFPRPCNLSRHLHAKHNMRWNTHLMLHMDVDDYLEQECELQQVIPGAAKPALSSISAICAGCFMGSGYDGSYPMTKSQFRFLLRKIRTKPSQWWVGKVLLLWSEKKQMWCRGRVKCIRPRSEICVKLDDGKTATIMNLYDAEKKVRLPILKENYELELCYALPYTCQRDEKRDLSLFVKPFLH